MVVGTQWVSKPAQRGERLLDLAPSNRTCLIKVGLRNEHRIGRDDHPETLSLAVHCPSRSPHQGPAVGTALIILTLQWLAFCRGHNGGQPGRHKAHRLPIRQVRDEDRELPVVSHIDTCYESAAVRCCELCYAHRGQNRILIECYWVLA